MSDSESSRDLGSHDSESPRDLGSQDSESPRDLGSQDSESPRDLGSQDFESSRDLGSHDSESSYDSESQKTNNNHIDSGQLPGVSIITPTYNRSNTIKLSVVNFLSFDYPKDKLEWIIIDDSDEPIRHVLPDDERIKYYYFGSQEKNKLYAAYRANLFKKKKKSSKKVGRNPHLLAGHFVNNRLPIGLKRNLGVAYSKFNYIVHLDDDDYYPKDSIKERIFKMLENPKINCLGCTQINQFHTTKLASIKTKASDKMRSASRIYESTLCYKKSFWERQRFDSGDTHSEGNAFLKNRSSLCEIIESTNIIVALIHKGNQDQVRGYHDLQPNGWHFEKIPDELFLLITSF